MLNEPVNLISFFRLQPRIDTDEDEVDLPSNFQEEDDNEHFQCQFCDVKFATEAFLNLHILKKHETKSDVSKNATKPSCQFCNATFQRRCDMLRHIRRLHTETFLFPTKRRRRTDIKYTVFCDICNKGYTRRYDMEKHRNVKHPNCQKSEVSDEVNFKILSEKREKKRVRRKRHEINAEYHCDLCNKGFTRKYDMQKHRAIKHPSAPKLPALPTQNHTSLLQSCKVPSDDNKTYYKCQTCGKLFHQSYNFIRHQSIHTGIRPFFCHICGKNFRVLGGLQRHINEHHYGVKKYPCDICGKKFAAKATRDDHRNIHTNNRPFVCDTCGKAFRQKASLHIHKLFHSEVYRFSCNICGKKYRRASELKVHGYLHTGQKPHDCAVCGKKFRLQHDLKRHLKVHDKLTECVCNECGVSFRQERYLQNHKKTHRVKDGLKRDAGMIVLV